MTIVQMCVGCGTFSKMDHALLKRVYQKIYIKSISLLNGVAPNGRYIWQQIHYYSNLYIFHHVNQYFLLRKTRYNSIFGYQLKANVKSENYILFKTI